MMRRAAAWICAAFWACPAAAPAEEVVLGLSRDTVQITANFSGSDILIYGAVRRAKPVAADAPPLEVIVTVEGPSRPATVYRKSRVAGIWVNAEAVTVDAAPTFYTVASSGPMAEVLSQTDDLRHKISVPRAIRSVGAPMEIVDAQVFSDALIRLRRNSGLYSRIEGAVELSQDTLFSTAVDLPANLTEGTYLVRIFLTRDRQVVSFGEQQIEVRKVGLERWLFTLAHDNPLAYGLMSLALACLAGWGASAGFQLLRRG